MDEKLKEIIEQWIIKANNDLLIAEKDIISEAPVTDVICFHAQQAVEKYLKLYAITQGVVWAISLCKKSLTGLSVGDAFGETFFGEPGLVPLPKKI